MKNLNKYIKEKLVVNKNYNPYKYYLKSWDELKQIIEDRYKKLGPGTAEAPINFNDIDISGMTTFYNETKYLSIFEYSEFEYIDVSEWNVSNITNMSYMFHSCEYLKSIGDISNWDVSSVKSMEWMFYESENLEYVGDLSKWKLKVSNVKNMNSMFLNSKIKKPSWYKG